MVPKELIRRGAKLDEVLDAGEKLMKDSFTFLILSAKSARSSSNSGND